MASTACSSTLLRRQPAVSCGLPASSPCALRARGYQALGITRPARRSSPTCARSLRPLKVCAVAAPEAPSGQRAAPRGLQDVVVVGAVRTPCTKALVGGFKDTPVDELVVAVLKELLKRTGVKPEEVEDVVMGSGLGPSSKRANEVRTAVILAGFPTSVPAMTVNRQCAAGLQSIADAAAGIAAGYYDIAIAGGVESMSHSPMKWEGSDNPRVKEHPVAKDTLLPMGITSDNVASEFHVPREVQDQLAYESHQKAAKAQEAGKFQDEIVPVDTVLLQGEEDKKQEVPVTIDKDDGIRADFTLQKLSKLRGCFQKGGTTTAANACQTTDGCAAVMLMSRAEAERRGLPVMACLRSFAAVGVPPHVMGIGPAEAVPKALEKAGLTKDDIDVFEINEAFASQFAYCLQKLGLDAEKVNPNGGAIALGHPIGCSGARQTVTLLHELNRRNKDGNGHEGPRFGVVSMCVGSGMGAAAVFETYPNGQNGSAKKE